jgi:hypothetical protein
MLKKQNVFLIAIILCVIGTGLWHFRHRSKLPRKENVVQRSTNPDRPKPQVQSLPITAELYPQISLRNQTKTEALKAWLQRIEHDKRAEWKTPIRFFGKVVDETSRPVADATIHFQWTDLSEGGTSHAQSMSDATGYFYLNGVRGKRLSVSVSKEDYYASQEQSYKSFEFSNPGEDIYYEPDPNNPILFHLRKKGEGATLVKKSIKVVLPGEGSSAKVDLTTGKVSSGGQLQVQAWKPWPPRPMSPHYDWKVTLTIQSGGFVEAHEEFAFEAPETVYNESFEVNMPATAGDAWRVSAEKTLYFVYGEPKKYGRLNFHTDGNSRYVFLDYVLNPSGSRNLEDASTQASNP